MPHPASSMSYKLLKMSETLKKVISGGKREKSNANRFIEKNLIRKFIIFWDKYSTNKFLTSDKEINYKICECFLDCSKKIATIYPEIEWFKTCDKEFIESLFGKYLIFCNFIQSIYFSLSSISYIKNCYIKIYFYIA